MRQVMPGLRDLEILHAQAVRSGWLAVSTQLCKKVIMRVKWGSILHDLACVEA